MTERPYRHLSGEDLRKRLKHADAAFAGEVQRVCTTDIPFRRALDISLALEDERDHRKGGPSNGAE